MRVLIVVKGLFLGVNRATKGVLGEKLYLMLVVGVRIMFNSESFVAKVNVTVRCDLAFVEVV